MHLVDPLGERPLAAGEFPLAMGGVGNAVVLPGCKAGEVLARVVLEDGQLYLESVAAAVRLDGRTLEGRARLEDGAVADLGVALLRVAVRGTGRVLVVEHEAVANVTLPPLLEGQPLHAAAGGHVPIEAVHYEPPTGRLAGHRRRLPWRRATAVAAGLAVLGVLALLLASVAVTVQTSPRAEPDVVDFVGAVLEVPVLGRYLVLPGDYSLRVTAEGYAPATLDITVARAPDQQFIVPIERLPGRVRIGTGGVAATLEVDGRELGPLPGEYELKAGRRELLVRAPRHEDHREAFDVAGGGIAQSLDVSLLPSYASVSVTSVPAGARVLVDGQERGTTPFESTLDAGRYSLTVAHPAYRHFETPITVKPGEPLVVGPIELGLADGVLAVRTEPAGADVSVAGRYRGRAPLDLSLPPNVPHEVAVSHAGYQGQARTATVQAGKRAILAVALAPILGEITVAGEPADAELFVDGRSRGAANQTLSLPAAPHAIEVRKPGLATFRTSVTPNAGLPQRVEYALTTPAAARAAQLPPRVRTALGQELVLLRGGKFALGSPRREPGRRSNEAQRTVELKRPFYLGTREVTNREFREFRKDHASGIFQEETLDLDNQPAARLGWRDAAAFCNWLSGRDGLPPAYETRGGQLVLSEPVGTGYRLPTEAEWEFAARHDGRGPVFRYPWGDTLPVAARSGNYADQSALYLTPVVISGYDDGHRVAAPVGSFAPNALGLFDLGGNVSEWVNDRYQIYVTGPEQVFTDPVGPQEGDTWTIRGSSWLTGRTPELRTAWRDVGSGGKQDLGFRIARYAE
ncbi:MAG TPA: PEGA domain-containing protein [Gammaproteobacteria bacterium]